MSGANTPGIGVVVLYYDETMTQTLLSALQG